MASIVDVKTADLLVVLLVVKSASALISRFLSRRVCYRSIAYWRCNRGTFCLWLLAPKAGYCNVGEYGWHCHRCLFGTDVTRWASTCSLGSMLYPFLRSLSGSPLNRWDTIISPSQLITGSPFVPIHFKWSEQYLKFFLRSIASPKKELHD